MSRSVWPFVLLAAAVVVGRIVDCACPFPYME
jgi:hypothetical protein